MSRQPPDDSDRPEPFAPSVDPRVERRRLREAPSIATQLGYVAAVVAGVGVLSYPVAAVAAVAAVATVGLVATAAARAVRRAAVREASVRVPYAGVEVTVAQSGE